MRTAQYYTESIHAFSIPFEDSTEYAGCKAAHAEVICVCHMRFMLDNTAHCRLPQWFPNSHSTLFLVCRELGSVINNGYG